MTPVQTSWSGEKRIYWAKRNMIEKIRILFPRHLVAKFDFITENPRNKWTRPWIPNFLSHVMKNWSGENFTTAPAALGSECLTGWKWIFSFNLAFSSIKVYFNKLQSTKWLYRRKNLKKVFKTCFTYTLHTQFLQALSAIFRRFTLSIFFQTGNNYYKNYCWLQQSVELKQIASNVKKSCI